MNEKIARVGSLIVSITVVVFAVYMLMDFSFGSFFICTILPISFIMMNSEFYNESKIDKKVASDDKNEAQKPDRKISAAEALPPEPIMTPEAVAYPKLKKIKANLDNQNSNEVILRLNYQI